MNIHIDVENFLATLPTMGYGMLGIFAIMAIIFTIIFVLNKVTSNKSDDAQSEE